MAKKHHPITGIEFGTATLKVFMGQPLEDGTLAIVGFHESPSGNRVVKGEVTDVTATADQLSDALNEVEHASGVRIGPVFLAVTGAHVASTNFRANVPILTPDRLIAEAHVIEATQNACNCSVPLGQQKIHTFQRHFVVDNTRRTSEPVGMVGNQLTADIHAVFGDETHLLTPYQLVYDILGREPDSIIFSGIADFYGVAGDTAERQGLLVIDIGAGVTEYVLFYGEGCMHSGQVAVGCEHIANDLSIGLRLPISRCRDIVANHGRALRRADGVARKVKVEMSIGYPPKTFRESVLHTIIELRLRELFEVIRDDLDAHDVARLIGNGIVLCGGGALIAEIDDLAAAVFGAPAIIGEPANVSGNAKEVNSPRYVTPIGLLHLGHKLRQLDESRRSGWDVFKDEIGRLRDLAGRAIRF